MANLRKWRAFWAAKTAEVEFGGSQAKIAEGNDAENHTSLPCLKAELRALRLTTRARAYVAFFNAVQTSSNA